MKRIWFAILFLTYFLSVDAHGMDFSLSGGVVVSKAVPYPYYSSPVLGRNKLWIAGSFRIATIQHLAIEPELGFLRRNSHGLCVDPECRIRAEIYERDANVGANTLYRISGNRVDLCFGAGAAAHFMRNELQLADPFVKRFFPHYANSSVQPGLQILGGIEFHLSGSMSLIAMNRTEFVKGYSNNFKIYTGIRFHFTRRSRRV